MGTWWEADEVVRFADALPPTTMLILDEGYGETGPASAMPKMRSIGPTCCACAPSPRLWAGGIRCGYAIGDAQTIGDFEKVRNHYGNSRMAQVAGSRCAGGPSLSRRSSSQDRGGTRADRADWSGQRAFADPVRDQLRDHGLRARRAPCAESDADAAGARRSSSASDGAVLDRCIRVSVGRDEELDIFAEELPAALAAAGG